MKVKAHLQLLTFGVIAIIGWRYVSSQWQQLQARRPGYDDPAFPSAGAFAQTSECISRDNQGASGRTITVKQGWHKVIMQVGGIDVPELSQPFGVQSQDHLRRRIAKAKP